MVKTGILNNEENEGFFEKLNKKVTIRTTLVIDFLFFGFYIFMNSGFKLLFKGRSNNNPYIDVQSFNSPQEFYNLIHSYGPIGRLSYIQFSIGFDFIYPLIVSLFLIFAGIKVFRKISKKIIYQKIIFILAIMYFLSECIENISFMILTMNYPSQLYTLFFIASSFTSIKDILFISSFSILLLGIMIVMVGKLKKKRT
ncbi:MAG: hypothetical protein FWH54_04505 [Methanobrevibacter sp.]|nr:hypothetical protein [Methanobrevibacter sp.]MCL2157266.1 hypothetical protein [Methanobrevibacter sp.]